VSTTHPLRVRLAAVLLLTLGYAFAQIGIVRPLLPADAQVPPGQILQLLVFTGAAITLFLLRSSDATAALSVLALALSGIANSGPPSGSAWSVPGESAVAGGHRARGAARARSRSGQPIPQRRGFRGGTDAGRVTEGRRERSFFHNGGTEEKRRDERRQIL
jgi:hypothetical protein